MTPQLTNVTCSLGKKERWCPVKGLETLTWPSTTMKVKGAITATSATLFTCSQYPKTSILPLDNHSPIMLQMSTISCAYNPTSHLSTRMEVMALKKINFRGNTQDSKVMIFATAQMTGKDSVRYLNGQ